MVSKVGLEFTGQYNTLYSEVLFPLHNDPLLVGTTYEENDVFTEIIKSKKVKNEKFKHVKIDKRTEFNSQEIRNALKEELKKMLNTKKFDRNSIEKYFKSAENIDKLEDFFENFILTGKIDQQNFENFYELNFAKIQEYIVINEKMARSSIRKDNSAKHTPVMMPEDRIISEEFVFPGIERNLNMRIEDEKSKSEEKEDFRSENKKENMNELKSEINKDRGNDHSSHIHFVDTKAIFDSKIKLNQSKFGLNVMKSQIGFQKEKSFETFSTSFNEFHTFYSQFNQDMNWPLKNSFKLNLIFPWKNTPDVLLHYFGKKITYYFKFTLFLLNYLYYIMFFGLALWVYLFIVWYFQNKPSLFYLSLGLRWAFTTMILIWAGLFTHFWEQIRNNFEISAGGSKSEKKQERMKSSTIFSERSLVNDNQNSRKESKFLIKLKLIISFTVMLIFYGMGFGITIGIFFAKNAVVKSNLFSDNYIYFNQNCINFFEIVRMIFWDLIFRKLAVKLISWVDPKYSDDYQIYLVYLLASFAFLNHFFVLFAIIFFKQKMFCKKIAVCFYTITIDRFFRGYIRQL